MITTIFATYLLLAIVVTGRVRGEKKRTEQP